MAFGSCPNCNNPIEEADQRFCLYCGTPVTPQQPTPQPASDALVCPNCQTPSEPGMKFCMTCGTALGGAPASQPVAQPNVCSVCGAVAGPNDKFCIGCGNSLGGADALDASEKTTILGDDLSQPVDFFVEPAAPQRSPFLIRVSSYEKFALNVPAVLGKGSAADVRISGNNTISRTHARVFQEGDQYLVEDLGSTNRTFVNGVVVPSHGTAILAEGDTLKLADEAFTFVLE